MRMPKEMSGTVHTWAQLSDFLAREMSRFVPDRLVAETFPSSSVNTEWKIEVTLRPDSTSYQVRGYTDNGTVVFASEACYYPLRLAGK